MTDKYVLGITKRGLMLNSNYHKLSKPPFKYSITSILVLQAEVYKLHIFINNLVAKAPGLNLGKKLGNLFSNCEALN